MNENEQTKRRHDPLGSYSPTQDHGGLVWQPYAMGGGQWVAPQVVRISDADVERIAAAVVRLLGERTR
jgi:hypothetical protein